MTTPPEGFTYIPNFLTDEEQRSLLQELRGLDYRHDVFRGQTLKRAQANFGYTYVAVGQRLDPAPPFPVFLRVVVCKALLHCPEETRFEQCIVTRYPVGAGIGWHTDARRFGDCIVGISLAATARLRFRVNGQTQAAYEAVATPGSLYVMVGPARRTFQHQIVPVKSERYSLTFRHVTNYGTSNRR